MSLGVHIRKCLDIYMSAAAAAAASLQSCPTLCDPIDCSPPGSSVPGILQVRILEWVAISFSNAWRWKVKVKSLSSVRLFATPWTTAYQAPLSMGFSRQEYWSGVPSPSPAKMWKQCKCPKTGEHINKMWYISTMEYYSGCPNSSVGKESTCNGGDLGLIPGLGRSTGEGIGYPLQYSRTQLVKNLPALQETWVWSLGWEDPPETEKATHSSILAWRIPKTV